MEDREYLTLPYISSSSLKWFELSPLYCFKRLHKEIEDEEASYLDLGRQIHMKVLEPEKFNECYTYLDFDKPASKNQFGFATDYADLIKLGVDETEALKEAYITNYSIKTTTETQILVKANAVKEELDKFISYLLLQDKYKDVLSNSKWNLIESVNKSLLDHKKANVLLFDNTQFETDNVDSFNELTVIWDYPIFLNNRNEGIKCKSKIDRLIIDHNKKEILLVDLKTTFSFKILSESFEERDYARQLSFYWSAVQNYFSEVYVDKNFADYTKKTYVVITTTNPSHPETKVISVPDEVLEQKQLEIAELMIQISWHIATGNWEHSKEYYLGDGTENLFYDK